MNRTLNSMYAKTLAAATRGRDAAAVACLVAMALAVPAGAAAQSLEVELEPTPIDRLDAPALDVAADGIRLSLDQAVEIALRRNLGLVVERYNWVQAHEGILQSLGIYDTLLTGSGSYNDSTQPTISVVEGVPVTAENQQTLSLGLSQLVPTGGVAELNVFANRRETNSQNVFLNPLYFSTTGVRFTQPLLRGFGRLPTERRIMVARLTAAQSREFFEQVVAATIRDVDRAYWDLVEARNQLVVAQEALALAQTLHDQNRIRVEVGTLAPLELIQSEAGIANREEDIIFATAAIGDAADRLRQLLNLDLAEYWDLEIIPVTAPETEPIAIDLDDAIRTAFSERPEIARQLLQVDTLDIDARFFRNVALPQLDVVVDYGLSGLSGTGAAVVDPETGEVIVPAVSGNLGDALDQVQGGDFDEWTIRLLFSYPLQNRERRAQKVIADLSRDEGVVELERIKQEIATGVRAAARAVETATKQIQSARVSRQLEEKNLDAEHKRYENGMSSSFRLLQIQEDLTQARSREVRAVTAYRRALTEYYRSIGRLLEEKGVELEGADVGE